MAAIIFNVLPLIPYLSVFIFVFLSLVGRQGFSLLRRRPLRRFAPCALRWQTLTRFLSSAPRRVRARGAATKKRPASASRFLFYGGPSGVQPASQAAAAALSRLARCAGKRSRVYSAPRPDGFEPVHRQQKSDQPESIAFFSMVGRQGFEPWTLGLKGAPRLISQLDSATLHPL